MNYKCVIYIILKHLCLTKKNLGRNIWDIVSKSDDIAFASIVIWKKKYQDALQ